MKSEWAERIPRLERRDLELILELTEEDGGSPAVRSLREKVQQSMTVYHREDELLNRARASLEESKRKSEEQESAFRVEALKLLASLGIDPGEEGFLEKARRKLEERDNA